MNLHVIKALMPFIVMAAACVVVMLTIAFRRRHALTALQTFSAMALALASLPLAADGPGTATALIIMDSYALYYIGLVVVAGMAVTVLSYSYLEKRAGEHEEYYLLLLLATLGTSVLAASAHFAAFFLGFELLSVPLFALAAYQRHDNRGVEAGVKYLILAAVSSAFILFGMALVYAKTGSMEFSQIAGRASGGENRFMFTAGIALILVGLGFKLALAPFHLWTPDVYEGAPAPITAFIATASKGGVFALTLRFVTSLEMQPGSPLYLIFFLAAVVSMFTGNLLALLQKNVKRVLAYSSISQLGYLMVALLVERSSGINAAAFYVAAYMTTMLLTLGVVAILSTGDRDADRMDDYSGLAWTNPLLAGVFTAGLLSLAGIPLTAGFIAKFFLVASGVGSALWLLVIILVVNSALSLFYYLRIIIAVYERPGEERTALRTSPSAGAALLCLGTVLVWLGLYPAPFLAFIQRMMHP